MFCKLTGKNCNIYQDILDSSTFSEKSAVRGLKSCSCQPCAFVGQKGCLLKENKD